MQLLSFEQEGLTVDPELIAQSLETHMDETKESKQSVVANQKITDVAPRLISKLFRHLC